MDRKYLIETLQELLSDEYDPADFVSLSEEQLVKKIIDAAFYYKEEANKLGE